MSKYVYRGWGVNGELVEMPVSDDIAVYLDKHLAVETDLSHARNGRQVQSQRATSRPPLLP